MSAKIRMLGSSGCWGVRELGAWGSVASSPPRRRGGGRWARSGRRGEGRELQRAGRWVQGFVGAPREAAAKQEVAGTGPERRVAWR